MADLPPGDQARIEAGANSHREGPWDQPHERPPRNGRCGTDPSDRRRVVSDMSDLEQERAHLALADQHIAAGEKRIADQGRLVAHLTEQGRDTADARDLLRLLEATLVNWRGHRQMILEAIARHTPSTP